MCFALWWFDSYCCRQLCLRLINVAAAMKIASFARRTGIVAAVALVMFITRSATAQGSLAPPPPERPKVVIFYSVGVEYDHLLFAQQALQFFTANANKDK
jgi:hypothetical protein